MTGFGERLKAAFGNAKNAEIARKLGVSEPAVKNYVSGRIPELKILQLIKKLTGRSLDWLIEGDEGTQREGHTLPKRIEMLLRTIADEQSHVVWGDVELAGNNLAERTLELLIEFLLARALVGANLAESEAAVMTKERLKRAQRFSFVGTAPSVLENYIRGVVREAAPLGKADELRDIIRSIVQEEVGTRGKVPVFTLDVGDNKEKTRKAG